MTNKLPTLLLLVLASPLVLAHDDDLSKINGSIRVASGREVGSIETVNGSIRLEDSVKAGDVQTVSGSITVGHDSSVGDIDSVNGSITLDTGVKANSVETVNGRLRLEERAQVRGDVTSVNGSITVAEAAEVGGHVENVNGDIEVKGGRVSHGIETTNGDIEIGAGSRIDGGILVQKPSSGWFSSNRTPTVVIGPGAVVNGTLHFKRQVELHVSDQATVGKIVGAQPIKE